MNPFRFMERMRILILGFFLPLFFPMQGGSFSLFAADEDAKITILVVNPSDKDSLKSPVVYYLPPEITPQSVVDPAGMEIKYDSEQKTYFLTKEIELAPKETKRIGVVVRNVWAISEEEIGKTREQLNEQMKALEGTKYAETRLLLAERVNEKIEAIEKVQKQAREENWDIKRQIEVYRANEKQLEQINHEVISLDALRRLEEEKQGDIRTIKFMITAENPSNETKDMRVTSPLPPEVTADDIFNKLDFDLVFDQANQQFALEKNDSFAPNESKKYTITIRDIWYIPDNELTFLKSQTEKILEALKGSPFEAYSQQSGKFIYESIEAIKTLQAEVADSNSLDDHKRAYALNHQRFVLAKNKIRELQDLMVEASGSQEKTPPANKIQEWLSKFAEFRDLLMRRMGYKPDRPSTWLIIFGICAFLAILSIVFYLIWIKQIQKDQVKKKPPVEEENKTQ